MSLKSIISALGIFALTSCTSDLYEASDIYAIIKGKVTDEAGTPIEHMEVSIELSHRDDRIYYTSSDGTFIRDITYKESRNIKRIAITITDTDGEDNGGHFATNSEEIHLLDEAKTTEETPMILNLEFRCSLANL